VSIHFTFGYFPAEVQKCVHELEEALRPFGARPHWGKLFVAKPIDLYPMADKFLAAREQLDPAGKFFGPFLKRSLLH
jgi:xylitol oxidase